jgi:hypothetical protein
VAALAWNRWQLCRGIGGSFAVESVAALPWNQRQLCRGISGSFAVERVAAFAWNQWQDSPGIGGSFRVEYADLAAELASVRYALDSSGCIQIKSKDQMRARLGHSPDLAYGLNCTFYTPPTQKQAGVW